MQGRQDYQPELFSIFNMEALIPKNHLLREIDRKIDFGFVRGMTAHLYCDNNGRPSIDPVLFVKICLLTFLYNIPSDRQVCEEIQYNLAYRWFLRLSITDSVPDHSSLTRIRDRLGEETFKKIFDHVVRLCIEKGFVTGERVMMDGSLIKADAAIGSLVPRESEPEVVVDIKSNSTATKNIKGKKFSNDTHVSSTDPDCALAGKVREIKQLRYKTHCTIDRDSRVILDTHITAGSAVDGHEMTSRLNHIEENFELKIKEITADRGYGYGINLDELQKRKVKSFVPNFHQDVGDNIDPDLYTYDTNQDLFTCIAGYKMERKTTDESEKINYARRYQVKGMNCTKCPHVAKCFEKPPQKNARKALVRNIFWELQLRTKESERTWTFRKMRGERQWKMEGIFAEAKDNHGLERARYRGRMKMQIQAYMIAVVQNIKRMMGSGPVVEVGLRLAASVATASIGANFRRKFQSYFQLFRGLAFA